MQRDGLDQRIGSCNHGRMDMNIYEMYVANGDRTGFWVQRESWGNTCALVKLIGGESEGTLAGQPPYHGNPVVIVDVFDIRSGQIKDPDTRLSCPGNYTYRQISPPPWALG